MLYILFKTFELFMTCIFLFKGNYSEHNKTCFYIATDQIKLGGGKKKKNHSQIAIIPAKLISRRNLLRNKALKISSYNISLTTFSCSSAPQLMCLLIGHSIKT